MAVGARTTEGPGYVRVFRAEGEAWVQVGTDIAIENSFQFGTSIALSADSSTIAVGEPSSIGRPRLDSNGEIAGPDSDVFIVQPGTRAGLVHVFRIDPQELAPP